MHKCISEEELVLVFIPGFIVLLHLLLFTRNNIQQLLITMSMITAG
jgi:hypothetical protein